MPPFSAGESDPKASRTSIGAIGKLKLSGRIILRVRAEGPKSPELLREASYNVFKSPSWFATHQDFVSISPEADDSSWTLSTTQPHGRPSVVVSQYLRRGGGLLVLPLGASAIESLPVSVLEYNALGSVRVSGGPGLVTYRARYGPGRGVDSVPEPDDLRIPENEATAIAAVAAELGLATQEPRKAVQTVSAYFRERFRYSTYLQRPIGGSYRTALADFLLTTHSGHCEYFATATALLLRQANIPTRFAAGFSLQEKSGPLYLVRERHAHAWCLAFIEGGWQDVDLTPASWAQVEAQNASRWEKISDAWSQLWFEFSKRRWHQAGWRRYLPWLVIPLVVVLIVRFVVKKQGSRAKHELVGKPAIIARLGADSEFYQVEKHLLDLGLEQKPGETLAAWVDRVQPIGPLPSLVQLHYRLRFDPQGLRNGERDKLKHGVRSWMERGSKTQQ